MTRYRNIEKNISVRSGVFAGLSDDVYMKLDEYGQYEYVNLDKIDSYKISKIDLMSNSSKNENDISDIYFSKIKGIKHDSRIGYYNGLYAGYVKEGSFRDNGSSGGFATWILCQLLKEGEIDGVIHVKGSKDKNDILFEYTISRTLNEVIEGSKSRYYPVNLSEVLKVIKRSPGKYAIVGIPEFITEVRLLCESEPIFKERIKYTIGLVCGHQKSTKYAECLAWQHGIKPGSLESIDFRKKREGVNAYDYLTEFKGYIRGNSVIFDKTQSDNFVGVWGHGFFKTRFSDFTDNGFNENADITLGDAWLDEYLSDNKGNNIVIVRNKIINQIIKKAIKENKVSLDSIDVDTIIRSQRGLIHHTRDELPYRLSKRRKKLLYTPNKRVDVNHKIPFLRRRVQDVREKISVESHIYYKKAVEKDNFEYFVKKMSPYIKRYDFLYKLIHIQSNIGVRKYLWRSTIGRMGFGELYSELKNKIKLKTRIRALISKIKNSKVDGAIITLPGEYNYGNIIQRYALKKVLENNGYNFHSIKLPHHYTDEAYIKKYAKNIAFIDKYLGNYEYDPIKTLGYRNYIVGSDQVWRDWYGGKWSELRPYFLEFLGEKKTNRISYAASFGVGNLNGAGINDNNIGQIKDLLSKFNAISVREDSAIEMVYDILEDRSRSIEVVLDPTILLLKDDYNILINDSESKNHSIPEVFAYLLDDEQYKKDIVKEVTNKSYKKPLIVGVVDKNEYKPIELWLKGFRDSNIVVTDSFHGVVFSIINNTDFIAIGNKGRGLARFESILSILGLSHRLVVSEDSSDFNIKDIKPIDWDATNKKLDLLRLSSLGWLLSNLK